LHKVALAEWQDSLSLNEVKSVEVWSIRLVGVRFKKQRKLGRGGEAVKLRGPTRSEKGFAYVRGPVFKKKTRGDQKFASQELQAKAEPAREEPVSSGGSYARGQGRGSVPPCGCKEKKNGEVGSSPHG